MDKVTSAIVADRLAKYAGFSTTWGAHACIGTLPIVLFRHGRAKEEISAGIGKRHERRARMRFQNRLRDPMP